MKNLITALALVAAAPALAIPDVVSWTARVENDAGPFDGTLSITFALFDVDEAGTPLWTESVPSADVTDGDIVHDLGSITPLDDTLIDRDNLFLQVTMNGDVLSPRSALRAVPYAMRSRDADVADLALLAADATTVGGLSPATFQFKAAAAGGLALAGTEFSIAAGSINAARLADGAVTTSKIAVGAVTATQLAANAVSGAAVANGGIVAGKLAPGSVAAGDLSGRRTQVRTRPDGCGGGLQVATFERTLIVGGFTTETTSCRTLMCGVRNGAENFYACPGSASPCVRTTAAVCDASSFGPVLGSIVFGG